MSRCECCHRSGRAKFEYLELLRPLQRRVTNQRGELARLQQYESLYFDLLARTNKLATGNCTTKSSVTPSAAVGAVPCSINVGDRVRINIFMHSALPLEGWTVYRLPTQEWPRYGVKHDNGGDMTINREYVAPV